MPPSPPKPWSISPLAPSCSENYILCEQLLICFCCLTFRITGSKKQSEERAALFAVRVHAIVRLITY